jgi:dynein heavy chain
MNCAKMTADDLPLFLAIMGDLFPGVETPNTDYGDLKGYVPPPCYKIQLSASAARKHHTASS